MTTCSSGGDDCRGCCGDKKPAAAVAVAVGSTDDSGHTTGSKNAAPNHSNNNNKCFAVVRENETEVLVFDVTGAPRVFKAAAGKAGKPCFSTHGNGQVDDLLTPCFDEDGIHGDPEESCFCGIDTPHIHAHKYDPKACADKNAEKKNIQGEADLQCLAQLTLHPVDNNDSSPNETAPLVMPVSARLPKQCNSKEISRHMSERGFTQSHTRRRMHKIQHDDHVDYLVHDERTGDLTLEHPCDSCGDNDLHGEFHLVGKRSLQGNDNMQLHVFEVAPNPFHILDHLSRLFDPNAERVMAARPTRDARKKKPCCASGVCDEATAPIDDDMSELQAMKDGISVRSTFDCPDICCASEIPLIERHLEAVDGVNKVSVNIPGKIVIVHHDPNFATANDIQDTLSKNGFVAEIECDGAIGQTAAGSVFGRSHFFVDKICCASEIPAINAIVEPIPGVAKVSINVTTKMVYVEHDTAVLSATQIADALNQNRFGASLRHDGAKDVRVEITAFVRSTLSFESTSSTDVETIKEVLGAFESSQVDAFVVDVPTKKIRVVHNPHVLTVEMMMTVLADEAGIETSVEVNGEESADWDFDEFEEELEKLDDMATRPSTPTILSGFFWVISMLSLIGGNWEYLKWVALVSVACGLPSIGVKAFHTLRRFQFDTNVLMFSAAVGALALQEFTEAAAVTFLFSISEWLEARATSRARSALSGIVNLRPEKANLIHPMTKAIMVVPASAVPVGSLVSVRTGDKIPCDGVVMEGNGTVDESSLTGESRPVRKRPKDPVAGGTINSGSTELVVRTTSTADNSAVARLIRLVEEAQSNRSPTEKLVDEFAKRYTPLVLLAALCMMTIPWAFGSDLGRTWTYNGLVLIVVACPCALIISTPVTYVAGLAATAQRGVLIKGGSHLEALGMVKKIAFDKTGTLSEGTFALLHLHTFSEHYTRDEILQHLTLLEERASHPLAQAIVHATQNENVTIPKGMKAKDHTQLPGEGIFADVGGKRTFVGNVRLFRRLGLLDGLPTEQMHSAEEWASNGGTVGFMSIEGSGIVCSYCVADAVRPESAQVVATLTSNGIDVTMLTGDNTDAANAIGKQVGLSADQVRSNLLPEDKLTLINEFMEENRSTGSNCLNPCKSRRLVLMCGDGVNDAPALAASDVGVAMGAGAALAMETSDVTLMDSELDKLVYSLRMGRRVIRKIRENVIFSLVVKIVVVGFALSGSAYLWAAIVSDVGAMLIVTLNGMMLLPKRKRDSQLTNNEMPSGDLEQATAEGQSGSTQTDACFGASNSASVTASRSGITRSCCNNEGNLACCSGRNVEAAADKDNDDEDKADGLGSYDSQDSAASKNQSARVSSCCSSEKRSCCSQVPPSII